MGDVIEVNTEKSFNFSGRRPRRSVRGTEYLSESVNRLVVFVFQTGLSQAGNDLFWSLKGSVFLKEIPNGVNLTGTGVNANDFVNQEFPPVRSFVRTVEGRGNFHGRIEMIFQDRTGFQTTFCTNDSGVFGDNNVLSVTSARHIKVPLVSL